MNTKVSEITEEDLVEAFGIIKDQTMKAGEILSKNKNTKNLENLSP